MKLLFVHQNFPDQFKHLAPHFASAGHTVKALTMLLVPSSRMMVQASRWAGPWPIQATASAPW